MGRPRHGLRLGLGEAASVLAGDFLRPRELDGDILLGVAPIERLRLGFRGGRGLFQAVDEGLQRIGRSAGAPVPGMRRPGMGLLGEEAQGPAGRLGRIGDELRRALRPDGPVV